MTADSEDSIDHPTPTDSNETEKPEQRHLLGQLFAALTARYRDEQGSLSIGVRKQDLMAALHTNSTGLNRLLDLLRQQVAPLGLELVEYRLGRDTRYCMRTLYGVPGELSDAEYAVLGVIVATIEGTSKKRRPRRIQTKNLETALVASGRISRYQLDKILRRLVYLGYIIRMASRIAYGPRLELKFDAERRQAIAKSATRFLATANISPKEGDAP